MDGLAVDRLSKTYRVSGSPKPILDSISFRSPGGAVLCVLGPNGSGKTTLLKILAGLVHRDAGRVEIAGCDPQTAPAEAKRRTGFCPAEAASFYGRLTAAENLRFFAEIRGIARREFKERLESLEPSLQLREFLDRPFQEISAGMRRRLALARALLHDPPVLLLDEPTQSLDSRHADELTRLIKHRVTGRPDRLVLWATPRPEEAWDVAADVAVLAGGKIKIQASPAEILRRTGADSPRAAHRLLTEPS